MKRKGNLFEEIVCIKNLILADKKARRGKKNHKDIIEFDKCWGCNILILYEELKSGTYNTSAYHNFTIFEPKRRKISKLPYRDRIVHHAILNIIEPIFVNCFISQSYSCIKKRGIHKCLYSFGKRLSSNTFCLKMDIKKFYPSINNGILKLQLRRKFKDKRLISLLDNIIDSINGVPLGSYTSQYFGNFYLNSLDHWIKEDKKVIDYFRYCDDSIILHTSKDYLHSLRKEISEYLKINLNLELSNWRIFPISLGIDFLGYVSYSSTYRLIRKTIKQRFKRMLKKYPNNKSINSYLGWLKHCNSINLINSLKLNQNN